MTVSRQTQRSDSPPGFNHGFIAHLMTVTHFVSKETLDKLSDSKQYRKLSMTYERYMVVLAEGEISPGELAARVGSSKQACSKVIRELEKLGLIDRHDNPEDGRSRLLSLSGRGIQLLRDGSRITAEVQHELAEKIGGERMDRVVELLNRVCRELGVELRATPALQKVTNAIGNSRSMRLNMLLQALTGYLRDTLLREMNDKGYEGLRANSGQILGAISREPRRIQYIASIIGISKQAASMMAKEFETLGYVNREPDPDDKRQIILSLSAKGEQLVEESIAGVIALEKKIRGLLGSGDYGELEAIMADLYATATCRLGGATPIEGNIAAGKIQKLTDYLFEELGVEGVRTLARHLTTMTRGNA